MKTLVGITNLIQTTECINNTGDFFFGGIFVCLFVLTSEGQYLTQSKLTLNIIYISFVPAKHVQNGRDVSYQSIINVGAYTEDNRNAQYCLRIVLWMSGLNFTKCLVS